MTPRPVPRRRRIVQLYERGTREIASLFGFCVAAVRRVRQQFRQRGTLLTPERKQRLQELLSERPDATLAESWAHAWIGPFGPPPSICGCGSWVGGIKNLLATEPNRPDVAEKRARWQEHLAPSR
jgi:hypothetical protein